MGPKWAAEALVLRPGSRFKKDGFLSVCAHFYASERSSRTTGAASGARAASAMARDLMLLFSMLVSYGR